jgi:hypothetical protein
VRLGAYCLTITATVVAQAQAPSTVPWKAVAPSPELPGIAEASTTVPMPLSVHITGDGLVRIFDGKGLRLLRIGLPGRPYKIWRDGGVPVPDFREPLLFPAITPLQKGMAGIALNQKDFRKALEGLLWIMDDGQRIMTIIHPTTSQVVHIDLPTADKLNAWFYPDHLEVGQERLAGDRVELLRWSIPWMAILPQLLVLAMPAPRPPLGTALAPFPK